MNIKRLITGLSAVLLLTAFFIFITSSFEVFSATNHIVISEVQIAGTSGVNEDFIELYNPTGSAYDLNGHRLVKRTASGTTDAAIKSWTSETLIPSHGYYLWANSSWTPSVAADSSTSATLASNNGVALRQGSMNTGTIIDSVAWGSATNEFVETSVYPDSPGAGSSIERKPGETDPLMGNGEDTDVNSDDFLLRAVSEPQNSLSSLEPVEVSPTPTEEPTPTPTDEPTPTPTDEPTPTPTEEPVPTPTEEPTPTPTDEPTPTLTPPPSPTPTPAHKKFVIGVFGFGKRVRVCTLEYRLVRFRFFRAFFPKISCHFVNR
jgi:hypothetical protein